jgi:peroxiredoxin
VVGEIGAQSFEEALQAAMELDAPLNERLTTVAEALQRFAPDQAGIVERLVVRLKGHHAGAKAPVVGERMPGFVLPDEDGSIVRMGELLRQGPLVINFHRGHWCPYCRLTSIGVAAVQDEVLAAGGQLVAIVPEHAGFSKLMKATAKARFPFLTDAANGYALSLNLAIWVGLEMEAMFTRAGIELPRYQGNSAWFLPIPATFVVNTDGTIAARYVDPDHRQRMEIDDMLAMVRQAH